MCACTPGQEQGVTQSADQHSADEPCSDESLPQRVTWLNKPAESELALCGTEKFIVFAAESLPEKWHYLGSAWEYVPSQRDKEITCRVYFEESDIEPDLALRNFGVDYWTPAECPELIRFEQRPNVGLAGSTVSLYRLDYRTWNIDHLLTKPYFSVLAANSDWAYLAVVPRRATEVCTHLYDRDACEITDNPRPFTVIRRLGDFWIVRFADEPQNRFALFEPKSGKSVRQFTLNPKALEERKSIMLSPNARYLAIYKDVSKLSFSAPEIIKGSWTVHDIEQGRMAEFPVRCTISYAFSRGPSRSAFFRFIDDDHFYYSDIAEDVTSLPEHGSLGWDGIHTNRILVDAATWQVESKRRFTEADYVWSQAPRSKYIPDYLEFPEDKSVDAIDIVHAFLQYMGVKYEVPASATDAEYGFSADGKRFLMKTINNEESSDFFYCDMEKQTVNRIPAPTQGLRGTNRMKIHCIVTP